MWTHILFDLDGTLTDPALGITASVQYALEKFDIHVENRDELIPFIGPPLAESFEMFYGMSKEDACRAVDYYREYYSPKGIYENELVGGIPELLDRLNDAGARLYVATSKPTVFAERILDHYHIRDAFVCVSGSELNGERVKKKDVINYLMKEYDFAPEDAVMVGDRHHDIDGAKLCGMASVGVRFGYAEEGELEQAGADQIAATVAELGEILVNGLN